MNTIKVRSCETEGNFISYSLTPIDEVDLYTGEHLAKFSLIKDTLRKLMGKTLTVIDASISDKAQNKAIKDIIKGHYNEELCFLSEMCFDQEQLLPTVQELADIPNPIEIDEVLGVK